MGSRLAEKISTRPSSLLLLGLVLYIVNLTVGPYTYKFYSLDGILYFALCFFCVWLGAFVTEGKGKDKAPRPHEFVLTRESEWLLRVLMLGVVGAIILTLYWLVSVSGVDYDAGVTSVRLTLTSQYQTGFEINKPWWSKLARGVVYGSVAFYLIVAGVSRFHSQLTGVLGVASLLAPATILLEGGRGPALYVLLIILFSGIIRVQRGLPFFPPIRGLKFFLRSASAVIILFTFYFFIDRLKFSYTGVMYRFMIMPGDMRLKDFYASLLTGDGLFNDILTSFYLASNYLSQSFPVFSWVFVRSDYSHLYLGTLQFSIIGYFLRPLGISFPSTYEIARSAPIGGVYATFVQPMLLDWGLWLTPIVSTIFGGVFGYIHRKSIAGRFWALAYYPAVMVMCTVPTIYGFTWGGATFVTTMYVLLTFVISVRGSEQPGVVRAGQTPYQGLSVQGSR